MLKLSNALMDYERGINLLEQTRIDVLGDGDPVIDDRQLAKLNKLGEKIWGLKRELAEKTAALYQMKKAYFKEVSKRTGCRIEFA